MVLPASPHGFSQPWRPSFPVFIHVQIRMNMYFRSGQMQKTYKQKIPGTNEKICETVELVPVCNSLSQSLYK